ncbi:MAG: MMPL family transporter, partial [Gemmatimonadota bacterium]
TRTTNLAAVIGRWSAHHRRTAILGWLAFVVAAVALGSALGTNDLGLEDGAGESARAEATLARAFPEAAEEAVLVQARAGGPRPGDPAFEAAVRAVVGAISRQPGVQGVADPREAPSQISEDGRSALVRFELAGGDDQAETRVDEVLAAVDRVQQQHPRVRIEQFGKASAGLASSRQHDEDMHRAETISLPLTLAVLVVAFGALVAAGIPLVLGATAVAAAIGLVAPVSRLVPMDESIGSAIFLIGLAVGVDYSMFYVRREREERAAGRGREAAVEAAAATSGRAVLISGVTVMLSLAGMFFAGASLFASFAVGMMLAVATTVVGSLTFLPATLAALGNKVELGRVPIIGRKREVRQSRIWAWLLERVLRRPLAFALAATALLLALAAPALDIRTAETARAEEVAHDSELTATYERIQAAFPGRPVPAVVVVEADDVTAPTVSARIDELRRSAVKSGHFLSMGTLKLSRDRTVARIELPIAGDGNDDRSNASLAALRERLIPATIERAGSSATADVTGTTAGSRDFDEALRSHLVYVFAFVFGTAFLLLLVSFRSLVVPIKAIVLNLLSVGAAYGVLKLVFQDGRFEGLLDYESTGYVVSWLLLLLFVLLFGISMDYHVFILSRVREAYDRGLNNEEAVAHGIKTTASVVTAAAVIMVAVFGVFATLSTIEMKQMGVGLATAILIDATVVRAVLLPATMKLLGDWNWYLPRWLDWLPRLSHEGAPPRSPKTDAARA